MALAFVLAKVGSEEKRGGKARRGCKGLCARACRSVGQRVKGVVICELGRAVNVVLCASCCDFKADANSHVQIDCVSLHSIESSEV